jgi:hypothetical protein
MAPAGSRRGTATQPTPQNARHPSPVITRTASSRARTRSSASTSRRPGRTPCKCKRSLPGTGHQRPHRRHGTAPDRTGTRPSDAAHGRLIAGPVAAPGPAATACRPCAGVVSGPLSGAQQHLAHHREVGEFGQDHRQQRCRGQPVPLPEPRHQPGPAAGQRCQGPWPGRVSLDHAKTAGGSTTVARNEFCVLRGPAIGAAVSPAPMCCHLGSWAHTIA